MDKYLGPLCEFLQTAAHARGSGANGVFGGEPKMGSLIEVNCQKTGGSLIAMNMIAFFYMLPLL
jgi:hypothetical protein